MKNKKMLSLLLSAIMLVGSMPAYVLAQGNDGEEDDPEMADQDTDEPDEDGDGEDPDEEDFGDDPMGENSGEPECIGTLEENKVFAVGQMEAHEVLWIQFTPTSTGRYGFLCADGCDLSCTFLDDYEPVYPIEEKCEFRYDIQYLNLEAGKTYDIEVASNDDATLDDKEVYCYICPMSETLPYGESTLFVQGSDNYTRHTFIPKTSGRYILEFSGYYTINAQIVQDQRPEGGYQSSNGKIVAELEAGVPYDITVYSYLYLLADVVHVNISMDIPSLDTGENRVELGPYYETTFCTFEPKTSGVYVIYSEGNEDTVVEFKKSGVKISDDDRGEGDNFVRILQYAPGLAALGACPLIYAGYDAFKGKKGTTKYIIILWTVIISTLLGTFFGFVASLLTLETGKSFVELVKLVLQLLSGSYQRFRWGFYIYIFASEGFAILSMVFKFSGKEEMDKANKNTFEKLE